MTSVLESRPPQSVLDSYPLASLQSAMMVNHLRAPRSGVDIVQMVSEMSEAIDIPALTAAWAHVSERHAALRTAFRWENTAHPLQEVYADVPPPVRVLDWTGKMNEYTESGLREFLRDDRVAGFDMRVPPLQRVTLIELGALDWRMIWTFHHALIDGRSFAIVLREVLALYDARTSAQAPSLPELVPFRQFAEWYDGRDFSDSEVFWREQLQGFPAATPLPANVAASDAANVAAGRGLHHRWLGREASTKLNELAAANGLTINNIIQGAWALMLALHAGEDDVVFGATRACRKGTIAGADDMVGLFINTVPVRVRINRAQPLVEWLSALRATWRSLFAFEHTPLRVIQRFSEVGTGEPLFNSQIVFESLPLKETMHAIDPALQHRGFQLYGGTNFALTGLLYGGERFSLEIEHDRRVIDDATAVRFIEQLSTLLEGMARNPKATVGELNALPPAERVIVVDEWNRTDAPFDTSATLVSLMAAQAARTPDAIAVKDDVRSLSYAQLNTRAETLAHQLRALGVKADTLVAVCADRSVELVVALVAVQKAGGAYVPLDPEYPADRLAFMLEDAGAPVLLAHRHVASVLPAHNAHVVWLDDAVLAETDMGHAAEPLPLPAPHDLAYMIYTSGSTGRPKGALNEHRGIVNRLLWMQAEYQLGARDVVLQKTPFSFDVSVWEFFWPLISGATLVMAKPGGHRDAGYLAEIMQGHGVTICHFVPSMLRAFLANDAAKQCLTLRDVMASGEALPPDLAATFARTLPQARLHNLYGPTECAVDVSYWPCPQGGTGLSVVPIGRPVANTQLYVLDATGRPVPIGGAGELFLAGVQVGRGYHNRADLTAERFVSNPFAGGGAQMYRTGDRARWRADGTVEYLGRLDFQVKIRGFRIELGEIESALLAHPSIREVVVVSHGNGEAQRLVAYVVAEGAATPSLASLRTHLMTTLPEYMVPALFVWLPALPLSSNGKVDRRALPDPGVQRESLSRAYVAPRNDREQLLASVWCRVLAVESVGVDDNFFELGGDSLLAVQILANTAQRGLRLTLTQLLRNPTVAALAGLAEATGAATIASEVTGDVPLTPVQQWFFEHQPEAPHHWNQALLLNVPADVDAALLGRAFDAVVRHHDSFRTEFHAHGDTFVQRLATNVRAVTVTVTDLSSLSETVCEKQFAETCNGVQRSLSLASAPLLAAALVRLGAKRGNRLLIAAHHLVIDGVSWRIVVEDLETAYQQLGRGEPIQLPSGTTPFSAWASELAAPDVAERMRCDLGYWESVGAASSVRVPGREHLPDTDIAEHSETVVVCLEEQETRALFQTVPSAYNTQINDVLLAALADALRPWTGGGELVVNVEGHGREDVVQHADVSRTTGWFTTIFPVRLSLTEQPLEERIKSTKELLRAAPYRGLSYGLLRYTGRAATLAAQPTPDVVFNYLGQFDQVVSHSSMFTFAPESAGPWYGARTRRPHALEINALTVGGRLEVRWSYNSKLNTAAEIEQTANRFAASLREIVSHCSTPGVGGVTPSDFPLAALSQAAVDALVATYPDIENVYPLTPMQELFLGATDPGTDPGFEQWRYRITGPLDVDALRAAWKLVTARHAILRTAFAGEGLPRPMQVVMTSAALPFVVHDLRDVAASVQADRIREFLAADRARGFAIDVAPLMRITLLRLSETAFELVWSNHHLLLDRWSWPLILLEIQQVYPAFAANAPHGLGAAARFDDFVAWQQRQDPATAREFWSRHFADYVPVARTVLAHPDAADSESPEVVSQLTTSETAALNAFARRHQLAPNSVIASAWALCLGRRSNHSDVSLGVAVSGRDAAVPGIERLVGLTLNNLPLRCRLEPVAQVGSWLRSVHEALTELQQFAYVPLASIQEWSRVPWRTRLFDTLLVFQHDDAEQRTQSWLGDAVSTALVHMPTRTAYPLSVMVAGREAVEFRITFDGRFYSEAEVRAIAEALPLALKLLIASADAPLSMALGSLPDLFSRNQALDGARAYTAPRNATESVLARIWGEVFEAGPVGVHDNFFRLGGYSLVATQIVSRVRNTLKTEAAVRLLFQHPTIAELAAALSAREQKPGQLERIAALVERVQGLSLDELRRANAKRAAHT